nr:retrovirus-related Pol polyprotein from transposon 17.6 [Tanacetum cinerariifolium]
MMAIFHDMIEKTMEVFMERMLKMCEDTNLFLNWEKSRFMVKEGIVLGHKISKEGIEVDKDKMDVITKLPHPTIVKDWDMPFELMCDASDFAIGAVLGKHQDKHFRPIHYASKLKSRWSGPFTISHVYPYGTVELSQPNGPNFKHDLEQIHEHDMEAMELRWHISLLSMREKRECKAQRNQDGRFKSQDNTRKKGNNEDTSSKAMLAINGVGFD